ncbi:precorrin-4 C(11)-methyltransferase [Prochlorococcus marinus]|uniref:Precorrin-4 C(11)-methyltransferase n=1 Tax=Prochlorococcus marinus XMU1408 TaxID=2213228 RepID=A0A318R305_PROMR|nr:precorrin-4 C(11)-methyltransferase [Prochlorococcus marinus]MBW3041486.1 precorrin-4 C(11)-methyltransferase [Prochlorococcus marinus str. XMU1408]PYE02644.1 precorrin-4 C(11)-methyltransferase [Prochlorococcus marinus XMU1408]
MNPIAIVGAGPGALDLMTVRAQRRLKTADVLVWTDSLIPVQITTLVKDDCEKIQTSSLTLEEILLVLIQKHKEGKKIVRLHDGDPCLYGAISEQICRLNDEGIEVEIIPGVSAYQATAATLGFELTIPDLTQTIILSRADGRTGKPKKENLQKLASIQSSLCLYLSARHVEEVQSILINYYHVDTPVAIAHRITWPDEWVKIVPLSEMAKTSKEKKLIRTTLYIISPTLKIGNKRSKLYDPTHSHLFRPK